MGYFLHFTCQEHSLNVQSSSCKTDFIAFGLSLGHLQNVPGLFSGVDFIVIWFLWGQIAVWHSTPNLEDQGFSVGVSLSELKNPVLRCWWLTLSLSCLLYPDRFTAVGME